MTSSLSRDLVFLILQFLDEEKFKETFHKLEQESGLFFNIKYFEELVTCGNWDEVEKYLNGFTKVDDNRYSMKIFFEIRKQKYLEALDRLDRTKAVDILLKDLKVFASYNEELFKEITQLITLENFRENQQLSNYRDTKTARGIMFIELRKLLETNPLFRDKLQFPNIKGSRLRMLINQSLNWQHSLCGNARQNPDIRSLFVDHYCGNSSDAYTQLAATNKLAALITKSEGFLPMIANGPFQPTSAPVPIPSTTWVPNPSTPANPVVSGGGINFSSPNPGIAAMSKGIGDPDLSRARISGASDRMVLPESSSGQNHQGLAFNLAEEIPSTVARTLNQGSMPTSMDFHPIQQTLLLVGTGIGDISLWDVSSREKLVSKNFQVWDIGASSMTLKASIIKDPCVSVKRLLWNADGSLFGVAYSKHLVQLYTYYGGHDIRHHIEIDAHIGSVNDLAFCNPTKQLSVITCGDDRIIKVWDVSTGAKLHTFEGHEAPVHSVCPHSRENFHFLFSTSVDGKIKAWLYDVMGSRVDYDAPSRSCTTMVYSADGRRLFSCGTTQDGESYIVEWNENEGSIKRTYQGFPKRSSGVVQFDTTKNRFLAVGDDCLIKIWDMDHPNMLTTIDAEGDLPASPRIRFNKSGALLAVSANENKIKILATIGGLGLMRTFESHSLLISRRGIASETPTKNGDNRSLEDVKPSAAEEENSTKRWKLTEISDPAQLQSRRLSDSKTDKIARLMYTNSGTAVLALASNAIHLLWKWTRNEINPSGKATTKVAPQLAQQASGILMTNDLRDAKLDEAIPCFALSRNDSYIMSASGGKISLFNIMTFKTMTTFMSPPPAATCLAFHPQDNNIVAVGLDDSTINIYNVRVDEVKTNLKGHSKRITSLAFSNVLNVLVSSGSDAQIIVWSSDRWERQKNHVLQIPAGRTTAAMSNTQVQFHQNQIHLLVVHETQLAIYETTKLECLKQWIVGEHSAPINHATFSSDSQLVYGSFLDGSLRIYSASNLQVRCQINPSAYLPSDVRSMVYPLVIAAHPQERNQFAIGLTDGTVHIFEPLESEGKWGVPPPPVENGPASCIPLVPKVVALDQHQNLQ